MLRTPDADEVIAAALAEDLGVSALRLLDPRLASPDLLDADVTSTATVVVAEVSGRVVMRSAGVVCGLPVVARLFELLSRACASEPVECDPLVAEGAIVEAGTSVLEIAGPARVILAGERSALDLMMVLSGIATEARRWQEAAGPSLVVTDTRKTLPGLRELSKHAVRVGGAVNHRAGLYDMVLIKDNHIAASGGVAEAVRAARTRYPDLVVECEADTIEQAADAARAGADIVLLDNMDDATLASAVVAVREAAGERACLTEASGGITFGRLPGLAATRVDRVSTSALTLARPLDVALDLD
jgi:nicotinate-nucleotide pyrophosphorylase (carboxylating)